MKTKKVIIPTDFSEAAMNAIQYGIGLAESLEGEVELVHVLNPATDFNTGYNIDPGIESIKRQKLTDLAERLGRATRTSVTSRFVLGFPLEELVEISEEPDVLLVIGATGNSNVLEVVFGNVASHLAQNSRSPVLIIPNGALFVPFKEIVYASNDPGLDYRISAFVKKIVSLFNSRLHSVHVGRGEEYPQWQMQAIFKSDEVPELLTRHIEERDVVDALRNYCKDEKADLLILATQQRDFWSTIAHRSVSRKFALYPNLPMMVFHDQSNENK